MRKALFIIPFMLACLTAACGLNMSRQRFRTGSRSAAGGAKEGGGNDVNGEPHDPVGCHGSFLAGLVDLQFEVVVPRPRSTGPWHVPGRHIRKHTGGHPQEIAGNYGLQGIFLGTLSQERGPLTIDTRLTVKFVSLTTGQLIWSTNVLRQEVTGVSSGLQNAAFSAVQEASPSSNKTCFNLRKRYSRAGWRENRPHCHGDCPCRHDLREPPHYGSGSKFCLD